MRRTSDVSASSDQARKNLAQCLKDVKSGKLKLDQNDISGPKKQQLSSLSGTDQYKYCVLHRDQVKYYYDIYTGLTAKLALLERDLGGNNDQAVSMREKAMDAEINLRRLLPISITGEISLIPDAAMKFSACNRPDFEQP